MIRALTIALTLLAAATVAGADTPHVDVDDLPPLPDDTTADAQTQLAVASAAAVEEDVVVGAAKREQSLGNVASAVTVISGDRLRRLGYRTIAEALRGVAGFYVVDDHYTERVGVRGLQVVGDFNTRLLLLIDGATVNEPWNQFAGYGWDAPVAIDDIARIEVIRGPVSSVYGTNAFFGIVNIVTRGATETPRAWGRASGSNLGGSVAAGFAMGDVDHQLRGSVAALGRVGEALTVPALGEVDQDGATALSASLVGAYEGAFAQARFYRRVRQLPFAPYQSAIDSPENTASDTLLMVEGGYTREVSSRLTATARAYGNAYRYRDRLVLDDGSGTFTDIGDSRWAGAEVRGRYAVVGGDRLGVTAGAEAAFISTESQAFYYGDPPDAVVVVTTPFNLQGLYAEVDAKPLGWLALTAGVRADRNSLLEDRVSPRAALFASRDRYGAKLLYAEGFRNPSAYEGFFEDGVDFIANPAIGAETIRSFEAVVWARPRPGLTTRLSGFRWTADRLVEQDTVTTPDGDRLQFDNRGRLQSTGVEVEGSYRDADGWLGFGGATVTKVEDGDGATAIGAPSWTAVAGGSSPLVAERFHISTEVHAIGARSTRTDGVTAAAFVMWNLVLYAPDLHGVDATVGVRNLLGTREEVPAPEDYDRDDVVPVLPGEGREFYARLGYRY
ncbi:MAG: TonB-dependent receptor [Myxococcales bacterium]|nr:TonB-dependent receptor [Myxococcales bacterium]